MKICLINNLFGQYVRGGAERVITTVTDGLVQAGHEVVVVSTQPLQFSIFNPEYSGQFSIKAQIPNTKYKILVFYPWNIISYYNLYKLPVALRLVWHLIDMFNIQSYFKIKKILKQEKPDLVMTHNLMGVGFLTPFAIRRYAKESDSLKGSRTPKHIHTLHDIQLLHPSGLMLVGQEKKVNSLSARIYQWCNKKLFSKVDVVISPSEWLLKMHRDRGFLKKSKCEVLRNPVAELRNPIPLRGIGFQDEPFTFLYIGQIEKHKGINVLLDSFTQLRNDSCILQIVGEGDESEKLEVRSKKLGINARIKFLGKKNHDEIRGLMQKANCLVVPSLCYENQPTVITEAKQNNLPVIASDIGGIPEMINDKFLFKAGDREELVKKMKWVIENYNEVKKTQGVKTLLYASAGDYIDKILKL